MTILDNMTLQSLLTKSRLRKFIKLVLFQIVSLWTKDCFVDIIILPRGRLFWDMLFRICHLHFCCYVLLGKYEYCQGDVREMSGNFEEACCYEPWLVWESPSSDRARLWALMIVTKFWQSKVISCYDSHQVLTEYFVFSTRMSTFQERMLNLIIHSITHLMRSGFSTSDRLGQTPYGNRYLDLKSFLL